MAVGEWGGIQLRFDIPGLRDFVDGVNGLFQIAIVALDLALTVMNVVKSFVAGLLSPIRQIIQELIKLLENLLLDFRRVGVYFNSDINAILQDTSFSGIKGGYPAYERRMISRLTNRADLTRPDFSPSNTVVALFFYAGFDPTFITGLLDTSRFGIFQDLINGFARLFGQNPVASTLPLPVGLTPAYASANSRLTPGQGTANLLLGISQLAGRDSVYLQWNIAPSPTANPTSSPAVPPDGFLIEVSCFEQGLYLGWYAPVPSSTGGDESDGTARYTTGLYLDGSTGAPVQIFGGADSVQLADGLLWSDCFDAGGNIRAGARPVFFLTSPTSTSFIKQNPIPVRDGRYYNQRTFYIGSGASPNAVFGQSWLGGTFSINIPFGDLPFKAEVNPSDGSVNIDGAAPPDQVWIRVYAVNNTVQTASDFKWNVVPYNNPGTDVLSPVTPVSGNAISLASRGLPSNIATAMIPTEETDNYMLGLQAAITLALLSRSDLVPQIAEATGTEASVTSAADSGSASPYSPTGLEPVAQNLVPTVIENVRRYFVIAEPPVAFSAGLRSKVAALAATLVESQGNLPPSLLTNLRPRLDRLVNWKWKDSPVEGVSGNALLNWGLNDVLAQGTEAESGVYIIPPIVAKNARSLANLPTDKILFNESGILSGTSVPDFGEADSITTARSRNLAQEYRSGTFGGSSILNVSESAPLLTDGTNLWYVRDVVSEQIYDDAQAVLQLAGVAQTTPPAGSWLLWRPFAGVGAFGLSSVSDLVDLIREYAAALDTGLTGIIGTILDFISALEQRVKEIQELVRRIQSYINIPLSFEIPDALILPIVASGTDGVVSALVGAGNKPADGPRAYSAGLVLTAGGLPSLITDLILVATSGD